MTHQIGELASPKDRISDLVVVRESAMYDHQLLAGMLHQTLSYCPELPGVRDVADAGLAPLLGEGPPFPTVRSRSRKNRSALFEHAGVLYLLSSGGAARIEAGRDDNAFVSQLDEVVSEWRPLRVTTANLSRLVRSPEFAGRLYGTFLRNVDVVNCGGMPLDLRTQQGKLMWQALSMASSMERDFIQQRLTVGLLNKYTRGEYVAGPNAVPPGYLWRDGRVRIDDTARSTIRAMLVVLADTRLPNWRSLEELGRLGLSSRRLRQLHGHDATFRDARTPEPLMTLLGWAETWHTGHARLVYPNPFPGLTSLAGVDVHAEEDVDAYPLGAFHFDYDWGLPKNGWAEPWLTSAVVARAEAQSSPEGRVPRGARAHKFRKPLLQLPAWTTGRDRFALRARNGAYRVERVDEAQATGR